MTLALASHPEVDGWDADVIAEERAENCRRRPSAGSPHVLQVLLRGALGALARKEGLLGWIQLPSGSAGA